MFRKLIIVVLTLGAVGTGGLWLASFRWPMTKDYGARTLAARDAFPVRSGTRINVVAGKFWGRFAFLIDERIAIPASQVDIRGLKVTTNTEQPRRRGCSNYGRFLYTPVECEEVHRQLQTKNLVYVEILRLPLCIPLALFAAYPALAFIRGPVRRWRRRKRGLCLKCGYDLRGSPGPRCPECGEAI